MRVSSHNYKVHVGSLCVHTALTLQETIAEQREGGKKVFMAYFDISKAFDSVWIDGLYFQVHELGISGCLYILLYKSYKGFTCRFRRADRVSEPYPMQLGIHQGGLLSLLSIYFIHKLTSDTIEAVRTVLHYSQDPIYPTGVCG